MSKEFLIFILQISCQIISCPKHMSNTIFVHSAFTKLNSFEVKLCRNNHTTTNFVIIHWLITIRPDSHRTLTLKLPLTLKYCLMHFYQSIHTVWERSTVPLKLTLTIKSKDIFRCAMSLSGRCESHFLLSRAQIIVEGACFLLILCIMTKIYRNYTCR